MGPGFLLRELKMFWNQIVHTVMNVLDVINGKFYVCFTTVRKEDMLVVTVQRCISHELSHARV